jgi:HlyD family secretion protein
VHQRQAELDRLIQADLPGETAAAAANAQAARGNYIAIVNGMKPSQLAQAHEQLHNAEAAVAHALAQLREATIYAPVDGVVASFNLHPGDMLNSNQTAAIIDTFADPYVYIYASQRDLERLRSARNMLVRSDSGAGTFPATAESYDRTAQFTPQNVETADQRAVLVYGVKLRIHDPHHSLLAGTTVTVDFQ